MNRFWRRWWPLVVGAVGTLAIGGICASLVAMGLVRPNAILAASYAVRGVDVSSYQGEIEWDVLAAQRIDFAIMKATEGSGDQDERFAANWAGARRAADETGLLIGAYHFLSFDSPAETQAQNIFDTVPVTAGALPITIDLECYADYCRTPPSAEQVAAVLDPLLAALEEHYGQPPIIYATMRYYDAFLAGAYERNPLWIRSVVTPPVLSDGRAWDLWQYTSRERLAGYRGKKEFIDVNVFDGSPDDLRALVGP
ncbi:GH25 family lysozyme [Plantibacter sp. LMC-P-059a]|uniref:GH25 family lysozyme n=1 Tax=Plantibacter sp. LMC-P-059a TaxID=3040297 RepID=UPI00254CF8E7|nr:GH25 family lysozyme [Plantibacter sp. LMC-P-059a]